nr:MAG TPA: hypothetical protein [Caudoviricetes sp.]
MRSTRQYTLILSRDDFYNAVVDNLRNLPVQDIFRIEDLYIDRLIESWTRVKFDEEYREYIFWLLMISDNVGKIDSDLYIWKVTRGLVDELVISLAEGFYYDDKMTIMGETVPFTPYMNYINMNKDRLMYFFDIVDTIYERYYVNTESTLEQLRKIMGKDYLK